MKVSKASELRQQDENTLREKLLELLREQFNLRIQSAGDSNVRPHQFKQVRRGIARIRTILNEKSETA